MIEYCIWKIWLLTKVHSGLLVSKQLFQVKYSIIGNKTRNVVEESSSQSLDAILLKWHSFPYIRHAFSPVVLSKYCYLENAEVQQWTNLY